MIGLVVRTQVVLKGNKDKWKSEDGTLAPFSFDGEDLEYAKDDAMDRNILDGGDCGSIFIREISDSYQIP